MKVVGYIKNHAVIGNDGRSPQWPQDAPTAPAADLDQFVVVHDARSKWS